MEEIIDSIHTHCPKTPPFDGWRNPRIVAISKGQTATKIEELFKTSGQLIFGENYVQEAEKKKEILSRDPSVWSCIIWHFTGRLQKNKVKHIVGQYDLIHSIGSEVELGWISEAASAKRIVQSVLLQVNLSGEFTKGGFTEKGLQESLDKMREFPALKVEGLMTMPPLFEENPEQVRPFFRRLRELLIECNEKHHTHWSELSMGTSMDYKIALEEGATLLRLGTVLFGERYKKS